MRCSILDALSLLSVYVQPQWIFDSINARKLLPADNYLPGSCQLLIGRPLTLLSDISGSILPPHFSPFVEEKEGDYVPPERFGKRQPDADADEDLPKPGAHRIHRHASHLSLSLRSVPSINLVENSAYLNGNIKRKRTDKEEPAVKPMSKEERVS